MKISQAHYQHMLQSVKAICPSREALATRRDAIKAKGRAKDIEMCLRWDLFYGADLTKFICDNVYIYCEDAYSYCDDGHVDTALKRIVKEIEAAA